MKTSELLDHLAVHVLDDRTSMLNGAADELWSDEFLIRLLNEAARKLCREAWVLEDVGNPTAGSIQLVLDQKDYALHKSVVRVLSGRLSDTDVDMPSATYAQLRVKPNLLAPYDFFYPNTNYTEVSSRPQAFATEVATRTLRCRPPPDATAAALQIKLRVSRMPIVELAASAPDREPEIPEEFHLDLTNFAAAEALSVPAADAALRSVAKDYRAKWEDTVRAARRERIRAEQSMPDWGFGSTTALVGYGNATR